MKRIFALLLAVLLCLSTAACGGTELEAEPTVPDTTAREETGEARDDPAPTGETLPVDVHIEGSIQVHTALAEVLTNGSIRFTLELTPPAGREISVFDPPNGENFGKVFQEKTTGEAMTLTFAVPRDALLQSSGITVNFYSREQSDYLWLAVDTAALQENPTGADPFVNDTDGQEGEPTGETLPVDVFIEGSIQVHTAQAEVLTNGSIRFTLELTPPADREISAFDPPNGENFGKVFREKTTGEAMTLTFAVPRDALLPSSGITVNFYSREQSDFLWLAVDTAAYQENPSAYQENPTGADLFVNYTDGQPTGQEWELQTGADPDVQILGALAQELDNGHVRFTLGFTAPAGRYVSVFYPPDDLLFDTENTTGGGNESIVFDIPREKLDTLDMFVMKFYDMEGNGCFVNVYGPFHP